MTVATRPPYRAYAGIMGTFVGGLAVAGALARALDRDPREFEALDLTALGLATFKAARTISRDDVTSFLREPFVAGEARGGDEEPVETGDLRQAIGELVTCSRCIGTWAAAGLGHDADPRAAVRAPAHLDARRRRRERLAPGRLRRTHAQVERARASARSSPARRLPCRGAAAGTRRLGGTRRRGPRPGRDADRHAAGFLARPRDARGLARALRCSARSACACAPKRPAGRLDPPAARRRTLAIGWDGRIRGKRVPDGNYEVRLVYRSSVLATAPLRIDTHAPHAVRSARRQRRHARLRATRRCSTTVSPNGDGSREQANISFRLREAATVTMDVTRTVKAPKAFFTVTAAVRPRACTR